MAGIIDPGIPRVMQRSYRLRSSALSAGPCEARSRARAAARARLSGVVGGTWPSGGSETSHARLFAA